METNELKVVIPEGYEIDEENSTFKCIKFNPINKSKFSDYDGYYPISGYWVCDGAISHLPGAPNATCHKDVFVTKKQAKSALAMAQISQIMANDERFGGSITDAEWENTSITKHIIIRSSLKGIYLQSRFELYNFLAFHTAEQRDLFIKENEQLIKDYLMID